VRLWIAQGFGAGRIPKAPGTFGSVVGVGWFALLLLTGQFWLFAFGTVAGVALSVWLCGVGEELLKQKDPQSVVLDEITAMPLCFLGWVGLVAAKTGVLPPMEAFFSAQTWVRVLGVFVLFRLFDVVKPWPVRQSQCLKGGWGVTIDDVLAAAYVNLVLLLVHAGKLWLQQHGG
jgi:phosphatidylglycerophosphatase A